MRVNMELYHKLFGGREVRGDDENTVTAVEETPGKLALKVKQLLNQNHVLLIRQLLL